MASVRGVRLDTLAPAPQVPLWHQNLINGLRYLLPTRSIKITLTGVVSEIHKVIILRSLGPSAGTVDCVWPLESPSVSINFLRNSVHKIIFVNKFFLRNWLSQFLFENCFYFFLREQVCFLGESFFRNCRVEGGGHSEKVDGSLALLLFGHFLFIFWRWGFLLLHTLNFCLYFLTFIFNFYIYWWLALLLIFFLYLIQIVLIMNIKCLIVKFLAKSESSPDISLFIFQYFFTLHSSQHYFIWCGL